MSFMRDYGERYDWLVSAFKDWTFTLVTATLYYTDKDTLDEETLDLYRKGMASFEDFYAAMGEFAFKEEHTTDNLYKSVWASNITSCSMVYMIIHEFNDAALMQIEELNKNGIPVTVYHISEDELKVKETDLGKNTEYTHIGYEDKLKEVL